MPNSMLWMPKTIRVNLLAKKLLVNWCDEIGRRTQESENVNDTFQVKLK